MGASREGLVFKKPIFGRAPRLATVAAIRAGPYSMLGNPLVELKFRSDTEGTELAGNADSVQGRFRSAIRGSGLARYFDSNTAR